MKIELKAITWLGVRTDKFDEMKNLYHMVFNLPIIHEDKGFCAFETSNGDTLEIFDIENPDHPHFTTGPVAGFLVDDIELAKLEMEKQGIEFIGEVDGNPERSLWAHFRGPDGNVYELKWRP